MAVMESRGFSRREYGTRHHGGYLGRLARLDNVERGQGRWLLLAGTPGAVFLQAAPDGQVARKLHEVFSSLVTRGQAVAFADVVVGDRCRGLDEAEARLEHLLR
ncbi:hypothetical protein ACQKGL_14335 [Ensifer adhaerens]|uniref:hypothetical protein n=1 Tax=Ensifer adhaerens TaxID=106592 RepID=UPI003CFD1F69